MVRIRLKRMGKKFNAFYRIVATDSHNKRDGKYIDEIGYYNPHSKELYVNRELRDKWLKHGASPSNTVSTLFKKYEKQIGQNENDKKIILNKSVKKNKTNKKNASKTSEEKK